MKKFYKLMLIATFSVFLASCTTDKNENEQETNNEQNEVMEETEQEMMTFTLDELAAYNGQNGMAAYIAYDGVVYDVTALADWATGSHNGVNAGTDVTSVFSSSPHTEAILDDAVKVGTLVSDDDMSSSDEPTESMTFTAATLEAYNGQNGMRAYIAYDGIVYDVTDVANWSSGSHNGVSAGTDVTSIFSSSPHAVSILDLAVKVGTFKGETSSAPTNDTTVVTSNVFTLAQLSEYNGQNGMRAYIAYNGVVYDVTDVANWSSGSHNGVSAGTDVTSVFSSSPHAVSILDLAVRVGTLDGGSSQGTTTGTTTTNNLPIFTLSELSQYNGQSGMAAYIAYNGIVYDVTSVANWSSGSHNGVSAGTDVTSVFSSSPHAESILGLATIVGVLEGFENAVIPDQSNSNTSSDDDDHEDDDDEYDDHDDDDHEDREDHEDEEDEEDEEDDD